MLKVGLTGGYASGKSFVALRLEQLGCRVIYADKLGHQVLEPPGEAYLPTVEAFGRNILDAANHIDRKQLAAIVFADPERLRLLNSIVHPAVFHLEERELTAWRVSHPAGIAVVEAAILIETGRYVIFDRLVVTTCTRETQITRAMRREGITREQALVRIERQLPAEEKKRYAHYVVDTEGTEEQTTQQVNEIFNELKTLAEAGFSEGVQSGGIQ
jgi:dephospho-CoA kinase